MALKAGTLADFNDSMAEAIADAFEAEWVALKGTALPEAGEEDRQMLFAAIAQGVVNYLRDNINDSLQIDVSVTQQGGNQITSSTSSVTVTQNSGSGNRVLSDGESTHVELLTE